jgi:hypothetical protein
MAALRLTAVIAKTFCAEVNGWLIREGPRAVIFGGYRPPAPDVMIRSQLSRQCTKNQPAPIINECIFAAALTDALENHLRLSPSRKAIASSSTRTASMTGTTGRAWNSKAGNIEQNL